MEPYSLDARRYIPPLFKAYVTFPLKLFLWWPPIILALLLLGSQMTPRDGSSPYGARSQGVRQNLESEVTVFGLGSLSLRFNATQAVIIGGDRAGYRVERASDGALQLCDPSGKVVASLRARQGEEGRVFSLYGATGNLVLETKPTGEGYKVLLLNRDLLARVKVKEEKFNLYDPSGTRILYGKEKHGHISLRDDGGSERGTISMTSSLSLEQLSALVIPSTDDYRALLFMALVDSGRS